MPNRPIESQPDLYKMTNLGSGYRHINKLNNNDSAEHNSNLPTLQTKKSPRKTLNINFDKQSKNNSRRSKSSVDFYNQNDYSKELNYTQDLIEN